MQFEERLMGMLKKAASGVLALLPCSRTESTLRAPKVLNIPLNSCGLFPLEGLLTIGVKNSTVS
jgi:hypothetical protein